jgi:acetolactate synthase I/II/III large subunit
MTAIPAGDTPVAPSTEQTKSRTMRGADLVLRVFEQEGVEVCFGIPGGAVLPIYDAIARGTTVRHVLARHEQGAGHMAQGYARASGQVGVVIATSGPGATNLVTPIADAAMDSTALVCVTGQVRSDAIGSDAFQECDIVGVTLPLVKHSWLVWDVTELAETLQEAFAVARSGRAGPVLVDIPRDVQEAPVAFSWTAAQREGDAEVDPAGVAEAAAVLGGAERPILYVGGGVVNSGASAELRGLAERGRIPVVTTLMAKGVFPESHALFAGWPGMHGAKWSNLALNQADVVVAAGARFDDRVTGRLDAFAPDATIVHLDVDPYEVGKVRQADVAILGPLREVLRRLAASLTTGPDTAGWLRQIADWRAQFPLRYDATGKALKPQAVLDMLGALLTDVDDVVFTTGVGQHQMWAMQHLRCDGPRSFITSGGHGTMGFGLPAAIGARAARPGATVVCVDGDGSFQMTPQELATAVAEDLPVLVVVINNGTLGMVQQWQSMFYDGRLSAVKLTRRQVDLATVARGFGADGYTIRTAAELREAIAEALAARRAAVLDVHVDSDELCYPIIPPGAAAVDMVEWPGSTETA